MNGITNWAKLNVKDMIDDAKRMDVQQLSSRYGIQEETVRWYLKKAGVQAKKRYGSLPNRNHIQGSLILPTQLIGLEPEYTVKPKYRFKRV